jgi:hypothetical protein
MDRPRRSHHGWSRTGQYRTVSAGWASNRGAMRPVFGVVQTPTRASVTIYQSAASNFFLRAALACAMPAHASVFVVRRAPEYRQSSETLSCQIVKLAHLPFLFESRLTKVRTPTGLELAFYRRQGGVGLDAFGLFLNDGCHLIKRPAEVGDVAGGHLDSRRECPGRIFLLWSSGSIPEAKPMRIAALLPISIALTVGPAIPLQPRSNPGWYKLDEAELNCLNEALIQRYGPPLSCWICWASDLTIRRFFRYGCDVVP